MAHTECPDCGTPLRGIKLTDATERMMGHGSLRVEQNYSSEDANPVLQGWQDFTRKATSMAGCVQIVVAFCCMPFL